MCKIWDINGQQNWKVSQFTMCVTVIILQTGNLKGYAFYNWGFVELLGSF